MTVTPVRKGEQYRFEVWGRGSHFVETANPRIGFGVILGVDHTRPDRRVRGWGLWEDRSYEPWASSHEMMGLRSTPIRSISASMTSPGLRYRDSASSLKPATPDTVPVERASPAL